VIVPGEGFNEKAGSSIAQIKLETSQQGANGTFLLGFHTHMSI